MKIIKQYETSTLIQIEQLHDELVNRFDYEDNIFNLYIDKLHFEYGNNYEKCKLSFLGFENIFCDISITFMKLRKNKIRNGKKFYLDEFLRYIKKRKFFFEILDIYFGYGKVLIVGKTTDCRSHFGNIIHLTIDSKFVKFEFINSSHQ